MRILALRMVMLVGAIGARMIMLAGGALLVLASEEDDKEVDDLCVFLCVWWMSSSEL